MASNANANARNFVKTRRMTAPEAVLSRTHSEGLYAAPVKDFVHFLQRGQGGPKRRALQQSPLVQVALGHQRQIREVRRESAYPLIADMPGPAGEVLEVP